jgi:hypothetical protein
MLRRKNRLIGSPRAYKAAMKLRHWLTNPWSVYFSAYSSTP